MGAGIGGGHERRVDGRIDESDGQAARGHYGEEATLVYVLFLNSSRCQELTETDLGGLMTY